MWVCQLFLYCLYGKSHICLSSETSSPVKLCSNKFKMPVQVLEMVDGRNGVLCVTQVKKKFASGNNWYVNIIWF